MSWWFHGIKSSPTINPLCGCTNKRKPSAVLKQPKPNVLHGGEAEKKNHRDLKQILRTGHSLNAPYPPQPVQSLCFLNAQHKKTPAPDPVHPWSPHPPQHHNTPPHLQQADVSQKLGAVPGSGYNEGAIVAFKNSVSLSPPFFSWRKGAGTCYFTLANKAHKGL